MQEDMGARSFKHANGAACADGEACARPLPNRIVKAGLILATILVIAALGFDLIAPAFLDS